MVFLALAVALTLPQGSDAKSKSKGAELEAALVRCGDVNKPAAALPLANCGSDSLVKGKAEINEKGDVQVVVLGGQPSVTYNVIYRSIDNSELLIGSLTTDSSGDGNVEQKGFFSTNDVGSGNIVLQRDDGGIKDQFVSGFKVVGDVDDHEPKFKAGLVLCKEVNRPTALLNCGTDRLGEGKAKIDEEDGELEVEVKKAEPNVAYNVVYRPLNGIGVTDLVMGTLTTNSKGDGKLEVDLFMLNDVSSGNIVLQRDSGGIKDQFVTGFKVINQKAKAQKAVFNSSLVRCIEVNFPGLSSCGTDYLDKGTVTIDEKGQVKIVLVHAKPNTGYEAFFRPIDGSPETDLGIVVTTNPAGNSNTKQNVFVMGTIGSGNVVLKRNGFDEFVTGFNVNK